MAKNHGTTKQRKRWGKMGGLVGGRMRDRILSPERKAEIARMGAVARWARAKA